jgi:hypothetical protein
MRFPLGRLALLPPPATNLAALPKAVLTIKEIGESVNIAVLLVASV